MPRHLRTIVPVELAALDYTTLSRIVYLVSAGYSYATEMKEATGISSQAYSREIRKLVKLGYLRYLERTEKTQDQRIKNKMIVEIVWEKIFLSFQNYNRALLSRRLQEIETFPPLIREKLEGLRKHEPRLKKISSSPVIRQILKDQIGTIGRLLTGNSKIVEVSPEDTQCPSLTDVFQSLLDTFGMPRALFSLAKAMETEGYNFTREDYIFLEDYQVAVAHLRGGSLTRLFTPKQTTES